jgi:hypothetical protein
MILVPYGKNPKLIPQFIKIMCTGIYVALLRKTAISTITDSGDHRGERLREREDICSPCVEGDMGADEWVDSRDIMRETSAEVKSSCWRHPPRRDCPLP